jgi:hypothetical protein
MKIAKPLLASAAVAGLVLGAFAGPAAAHKRSITQVYGADWPESNEVHTQAWLNPETHAGTMKTTLQKKNAAGDWVKIATKKATYQLGWGYTVNFNSVAGNKRCRAVAKFTSDNHPTISKASPAFDC